MNLKKIWENRKAIYEGIKNSVIRDKYVEDISAKRMLICEECPEIDLKGSKCEMPGTQPCCGNCGCSLAFKTRSLSSECPIGEWPALMTEKEEDKLGEL
jgi:hypothetical protein|tara:strand:+ start:416 stop:712 length:297 start_codon:yes stop_codon:yes gene_type:complete